MGFKEAKKKLIECLENGNIRHEERCSIDIKNLYAIGEITTEEVINIVKIARGNNYESSPHHYDRSIEVHIIRINTWYIKWYFSEPNTIFISIHK